MASDEDATLKDNGPPFLGEDLCPDCSGSGTVDDRPCPTCGGSGKVAEPIGGE